MKGELRRIDEGVWEVEDTLRVSAGLYFPVRMTVIRLQDGKLWLHSPVPIDDALAAKLAEIGEVGHIVAPSLFHHTYLGAAADRYPDAVIHGAPGLAEKRADLRFDRVLGQGEPGWGEELDAVFLEGAPRPSETVFLHRPTGTLLVTDLFFHILEPRGLITRVMLWLTGTRGRLGQSRSWLLFARDRPAFDAALDRMVAWPFRRVVPCHGARVEEDARRLVMQALGRQEALAMEAA